MSRLTRARLNSTCVLQALLVLGGTSCSVYRVSPYNPADPAGVPFIPRRAALEQTTRYELWFWRVTIKSADGKQEKTVDLSASADPSKVVSLALATAGNDLATLNIPAEHTPECDLWTAGAKCEAAGRNASPSEDKSTGTQNARFRVDAAVVAASRARLAFWRVGNERRLVSVAAEERLALNVLAPLFGSGEGSVKLGADGSLQEATAKSDMTSLGETLGIKDIATGLLSIESANSPGAAASSNFELTIKRVGFAYTLTQEVARGSDVLAFDFDLEHIPYTRTPLDAVEATKKQDGKSYSFSGAVTPPAAGS